MYKKESKGWAHWFYTVHKCRKQSPNWANKPLNKSPWNLIWLEWCCSVTMSNHRLKQPCRQPIIRVDQQNKKTHRTRTMSGTQGDTCPWLAADKFRQILKNYNTQQMPKLSPHLMYDVWVFLLLVDIYIFLLFFWNSFFGYFLVFYWIIFCWLVILLLTMCASCCFLPFYYLDFMHLMCVQIKEKSKDIQ